MRNIFQTKDKMPGVEVVPSLESLVSRAKELFREKFGREAEVGGAAARGDPLHSLRRQPAARRSSLRHGGARPGVWGQGPGGREWDGRCACAFEDATVGCVRPLSPGVG